MTGGAGNDTYVVDNAGDVVDGSAQRGHRHGAERRSATRSAANVENLTLTGTGASTAPATRSTTSSPATAATTS